LRLVPAVLKVDVEGAEWQVLKGAAATLERHSPRLSLSLHDAALKALGSTPREILQWLEPFGYRFDTVAHDHELHVIGRSTRERVR
jgi:hypothetical protein